MTDFDLPSSAAVESATAPEAAAKHFTVQFWGVRGGIATPGPHTVRYGGNTACIEVRAGQEHLVFDAGTGVRLLGQHLRQTQHRLHLRLFFTHTLWDRIQGFPFFSPAFDADNRLDIYGATAQNGASIKQQLMDQMLRPNFTRPLQTMAAAMVFHNIGAGSTLEINDVTVRTVSLNRETRALGYRVSWGDRSLVYATDVPPKPGEIDPNLIYLAAGADLLIFDSTSPEDGHPCPPTTHQPWKLGVEVAQAAQVKQLVMVHHSPDHHDDHLDQVEATLQQHHPHALLAREGMTISLV